MKAEHLRSSAAQSVTSEKDRTVRYYGYTHVFIITNPPLTNAIESLQLPSCFSVSHSKRNYTHGLGLLTKILHVFKKQLMNRKNFITAVTNRAPSRVRHVKYCESNRAASLCFSPFRQSIMCSTLLPFQKSKPTKYHGLAR